ncbi:FAD/NAD(P)-binding domain-containing protein [Atractiella rhizophila]|nr:FAD/NAD(P)-binding domain-containing protein [Atractiella rhizophila]
MLPQPLGQRRPLKLIYVGGGASGINMAYKVKTHLKDVTLTCYEKNAGLTGTWFENKYPGCACDIPSHTYQFTWALYPDWPSYYSTSDQIQAYMEKVVDDFDLRGYFKTSHEVVGARWDAESSHWIVKVVPEGKREEAFEDWCDFFINGSGLLNAWKWPDIKGLHDFKGKLTHTAAWDRSISLKGKKVALIGVGSSAVQVLPNIQGEVEHVYHFIRSKTWITPSFAAKYAGPGGSNFDYDEERKEEFRKDEVKHREYIQNIEFELNKRWKFVIKDSEAQKEIFDFFKKEMITALNGRQDLIDILVPDFAVGCRRLTPAPGFLAALQKENVTPVTTGIERVTEKGVMDRNGKEYEVDVIICATGFDISFKPRFPLLGTKGVDLRQVWKDRARAYQSMFVPGFPNYLVVMGPGSPSAHGALIPSTEHVSDYAIKVLHRLQTEPIKTIEVKQDVVDELYEHAQEQLKTTAWASTCSSWFKNGKPDGPLDSLHPGGRLHYFSTLQNPRWEDFNYIYSNNRFAHYGNGFTLREVEERDIVHSSFPHARVVTDAPHRHGIGRLARG